MLGRSSYPSVWLECSGGVEGELRSECLGVPHRRTQEFCEVFGVWVTVRRVDDMFSFSVLGLVGN